MVWPFLYPVKTQEGPRWCVDSGEGKLPKRRRWKFQSKTAAERKAAELRGVWESYGRSGFMSDVDRADVLAARAKLAEFQLANTRLVEAVDFYILHKKPHGGDVTLQELFDKLIVERELSPRPPSPSYRRSLDEILGPWLKDKGTRMVIGFTFSSHPQSRSGWLVDVDTTDAGCPSRAAGRPGSAGLTGARDGFRLAA